MPQAQRVCVKSTSACRCAMDGACEWVGGGGAGTLWTSAPNDPPPPPNPPSPLLTTPLPSPCYTLQQVRHLNCGPRRRLGLAAHHEAHEEQVCVRHPASARPFLPSLIPPPPPPLTLSRPPPPPLPLVLSPHPSSLSVHTNGNISKDDEYGEVIQLQGDHRHNAKEWLLENEVLTANEADRIVIHGF